MPARPTGRPPRTRDRVLRALVELQTTNGRAQRTSSVAERAKVGTRYALACLHALEVDRIVAAAGGATGVNGRVERTWRLRVPEAHGVTVAYYGGDEPEF